MIYKKFHGWRRICWAPDTPSVPEYVNVTFPEVRLKERYDVWEGVSYFFIVIEFEKKNGDVIHGCAYTVRKPYEYILSLGNRFIKTGQLHNELRINYSDFKEFMNSWKGRKRQAIIEKHMRYFFVEESFREKDDVWRYADKLIEQSESGVYDAMERSTYLRPTYRWKTEEMILKTIKKLYKGFNVIYQYKPFFCVVLLAARCHMTSIFRN